MRKYLWLVTVLLIGYTFFIVGCDETEQMMESVLTEPGTSVELADVLIYKSNSWWIEPSDAAIEAEIAKNRLQSVGIQVEIIEDEAYVKDWMLQTTADGSANVLILYGVIPDTIYQIGNIQPDGSVAESWLETPDGNTILNHADYLGWNSQDDPYKTNLPPDEWSQTLSDVGTNKYGTLRNLMDLPNIAISTNQDNTSMVVTEDGTALTPSLVGFESDRPFPLTQLGGEWFAEQVFASDTGNSQATLADPVILRDGNRGRLAIVHQTAWEDNPKGEVASEIIINYLLNPSWVDLKMQDISLLPTLKSQTSNTETAITFVNKSKAEIALYWLDFQGNENFFVKIAPDDSYNQSTYAGHVWLIKDANGNNLAVYNAVGKMGRVIISEASGELEDTIVDFPDPNLHAAVQEALDLASGDAITLGMLQTLTQLDAWDREITDLTGLEQATQLKVLNLHSNAISDMNPLAGLTHLTELSLSLNEISDITPLAGLTQLTELILYENEISDLSPITGLTQLTELGLRDNQITDISPLAELTRLTVLDLGGNNITDINPIASLVNLEFLFLEEGPITNREPLNSLLEKNPNLQINIDTNN